MTKRFNCEFSKEACLQLHTLYNLFYEIVAVMTPVCENENFTKTETNKYKNVETLQKLRTLSSATVTESQILEQMDKIGL